MNLAPGAPKADNKTIDSASLEEIKRVVRDRLGIQLDDKDYLIVSRLGAVATKMTNGDVVEVGRRIRRQDPRILDAVSDAMTTNETSFYRNATMYRGVEVAIRELLERRGADTRLRIWCAACSSGQEPYSLAMMINEKFPDLADRIRTQIVATDVSPTMVAQAAVGSYDANEMRRGLPPELASRYFRKEGDRFVVVPEVKALVSVRKMNLLESWAGIPRSDFVLVRNVLIYFSQDNRRRILERVRSEILRPGGLLIMGATETATAIDPGYRPEMVGGETFFAVKD